MRRPILSPPAIPLRTSFFAKFSAAMTLAAPRTRIWVVPIDRTMKRSCLAQHSSGPGCGAMTGTWLSGRLWAFADADAGDDGAGQLLEARGLDPGSAFVGVGWGERTFGVIVLGLGLLGRALALVLWLVPLAGRFPKCVPVLEWRWNRG